MRSWQRALIAALLVAAVAAAGIALNFALLGRAQDDNGPLGKLSPRAVFLGGTDTAPTSSDDAPSTAAPTPPAGPGAADGKAPDDGHAGRGGNDGDGDRDPDDD
jgi:hypothetical protein